MLYYWLKFPIRMGFITYCRKVFMVGEDELPKDVPIVYASNHPTAFLDPILPAAFLDKAVWFALRGDSFSSKTAKFFLNQVHCVPFFRFGDGFQSLRQNAATFKFIYKLLAGGKFNFLIMAEGRHGYRKKLKPIQKGTANIAFGAWKKHKLDDIAIVPTAINFTDSHQFRSWLTLKYVDAIHIKDYAGLYEEDPRKAVEAVTEELEERLRKNVVHIEYDADEPYVNQLLDIERNNARMPVFPVVSKDSSMLKKEIRIADVVNSMDQTDKEEMFELMDAYNAGLEKNKLSDLGLAQPNRYNLFNSILLLLGLVPYLVGYALNWPPFKICYKLADRMANKIEFHASLRLALGLFVIPAWWVLLLTGALIAGAGWWSLLVFALPFLGYFALTFQELFEKWNAARKVAWTDKKTTHKLTLIREDLLGRVED
ncbi:MAG: hypothetical protein GYB31_19930 [Bacteroidetes bacterium]|nr:hypothetical protein [Bacteroidota bacterium]